MAEQVRLLSDGSDDSEKTLTIEERGFKSSCQWIMDDEEYDMGRE